MQATGLSSARPCASLRAQRTSQGARRRAALVVRAGDGPLREFREDTGEVTSSGSSAPKGDEQPPKFLYADENPPPPRDTMSPEMKARLRKEYYGLGGAPNQSMGGNYFLYIILGISLLAVLSKLTGAI